MQDPRPVRDAEEAAPETPAQGRRGALFLLAGAALPALLPARARAQTTVPPSPAPAVTPSTTPAVTLPTPPLIAPTPGAPARPPAPTSATPTAAIDKTKSYYLFFDQAIDAATMLKLRQQLANLVDAGAEDITLSVSSPGGQIGAVLLAYSFIRALPARVRTHAQGYVASAATVLYLAGENRTSDRNAHFLFHPSQSLVAGQLGEQQLRESLATFDGVVDMTNRIYRDRTTLPAAEIERFGRETVIYTADQACSYGVVNEVADLRIPGENKAKIIFLD